MLRVILLLLLTLACAPGSPSHPSPAPAPPPAPAFEEVVARLPEFYQYGGWVISENGDDHHGDSLLFTGLALYGLPCAEGEPPAAALEAMLKTGAYYRYPGDADTVSMDGLLGLYRGIAHRVDACNENDRWAAALRGAPDVSGLMPAGFDYVRQLLLAKLNLGSEPTDALKDLLAASAETWTRVVNVTHSACFRGHLSLIALQTVDELGGDIDGEGFCDASKGMRIETAEEYCGRGGLQDWLGAFTYDVWEYAHQRCPSWEAADGNGGHHPAVDFLVAHEDLAK